MASYGTDVVSSIYPALKIGNVVIWDLREFDKTERNELLTDDSILQPQKKSENYITFCKSDFNIKSLIYEKATSEEILLAWKSTWDELKLDRLVNLFLRDAMYNLFLTKQLHEEPDSILLLRLVFWYYRCDQLTDTFKYKKSEIKKKLTRRLLNQRESLSKQLDVNESDNSTLNTLISDWEQAISLLQQRMELLNKSRNYRVTWFKDIWNVTSELLFPGVLGEYDLRVTFEPLSKDHDYDFVVEGYPVQMKSLNTEYDTYQSFANVKAERMKEVKHNQITYEKVVKIISSIIRKKATEIENALERGASLIFINGTSDPSGQNFSQYCFSSGRNYSIRESVGSSIDLIKFDSSFVPIIFCSTAIRLTYYVDAIAFKVPLVVMGGRKVLDRNKEIVPLRYRSVN